MKEALAHAVPLWIAALSLAVIAGLFVAVAVEVNRFKRDVNAALTEFKREYKESGLNDLLKKETSDPPVAEGENHPPMDGECPEGTDPAVDGDC